MPIDMRRTGGWLLAGLAALAGCKGPDGEEAEQVRAAAQSPYDPQDSEKGLEKNPILEQKGTLPPGTTLQNEERRYRTEQEQDQAAIGRQGGMQGTDSAQRGDPEQLGVTGNQLPAEQVQGIIESIDLGAGRLTLRTESGSRKLRAAPGDLANLRQGQAVVFSYGYFGGEAWLSAAQPGPALSERYGTAGTLTGKVVSLDAESGKLRIAGVDLRAHPAQIQTLQPGQNVSIAYSTVDGAHWVADIKRQTGDERPSEAGVQPPKGDPTAIPPQKPGAAQPGDEPDTTIGH
jgi:hypothetical protein